MSTQHNSKIAIEAYNLLQAKCPKCSKGHLSAVIEDLEKRKQSFANNKTIYLKCDVCSFTKKI